MSHINYAFNPEDDALPRDKMKLRNIASTKYSGDWPSIPHSHSYAELFYIVDGEGQFQINDKLVPVQAHQLHSFAPLDVGIIYDTHGANIYIKICTAKFLFKFLECEWIIKTRSAISLRGSRS